ncbi:uncharacterized protein LOC118440021 isoform X1 [Vespa mandarinia]|uniref:uncharacterized protein LOC118440021 isoform X1 n=2 Tax=Vespa mandarinia TaxID=7446 RepID=UPI00161C0747|nr:uncharacterized protein LOC118440021 isoform X1 [Vespa mandarinia]XP_035718355.1 uncharacterized protein LOC118440021 isoform X1 [Vespa mandarinia]XP_035718356.1 uncharacterized protein LOC118440021 isoform X1 [Vespa mandarinia]
MTHSSFNRRESDRGRRAWSLLIQVAIKITNVQRLICSCFLMATAVLSCRRSEFQCNNGHCVALNKVCNVVDDCGDGSDEVRQCSPCNKTYFGDVGKTYGLELHRPKEDKVPYICKLTFTAPGGDLGDIIQLNFDSFTLGKFVSFTAEGCPDGSLQISEAERPDVGGLWCGTTRDPAIYYSETSSVSITLKLLRLSKDQKAFNFDFRMAYKMIRKSDAVVRYGNPFVGMTQVTTTKTTTTATTTTTTTMTTTTTSRTTSTTTTSAVNTEDKPTVEYTNTSMAMLMVEQHPVTPTKSTSEQYLGDLISGTYCSRIFSDCDQKKCRLQSPNFPGLYPRNLTCYYAVRQHEVPPGKYALISVGQPRGQLVAVRSRPATQGESPPRELHLWQDCDVIQDYVTVYDGYTTRDPVILKFCGGGEPVPEATSSGPEILVEFTTSPYGTFLHSTPQRSLHGFQLEVQVKFVDADSPTYAKNKRCEFWLKGNSGGVLESPRHSLPRNSSCLYHLRGAGPTLPSPTPPRPLPKFPEQRPGTVWRRPAPVPPQPQFRVWLSILKFHVGITASAGTDEDCSTTLMVWDGEMMPLGECNEACEKERQRYIERLGEATSQVVARPANNTTLLARYCKDKVPRTCDHAILQNVSRPCSLGESFVSSGNSLTIEMRMIESTALRPVNFRALYEFVDLHQDGEAYGSGPCSRAFYSRNRDTYPDRRFQGPRDIFLYGRGGSKNLSCVYRFEGEHDEVVKLRFNRLLNGNRTCRSVSSSDFNRLLCIGSDNFSLKVLDLPWPNAPAVQRDCFCSNRSLPMNIKSSSNIVEVHLTVTSMNALDDYNNIFFEGTWEFVKTSPCLQKRRVRGPSGVIKYRWPLIDEDERNCEKHPWLIDPAPGQYLYVKTHGSIMTNRIKCATKNRIVLHAGGNIRASVCPKPMEDSREQVVEIFSDGWSVGSANFIPVPGRDPVRTIAVEFLISEPEAYGVTWLELTRRPATTSTAGLQMARDCVQRCPELDACINASLWCDGVSHCPSGYDEALKHCSMLLRLPPLHFALGVLAILTILVVIFIVIWRICRQRTSRSISQHRLKSISSETAIIEGKEVIC